MINNNEQVIGKINKAQTQNMLIYSTAVRNIYNNSILLLIMYLNLQQLISVDFLNTNYVQYINN